MSATECISSRQLFAVMFCSSLFSTVITTSNTPYRSAVDYVAATLFVAGVCIWTAYLCDGGASLTKSKLGATALCALFVFSAASASAQIGSFYSYESDSPLPASVLIILIVAVAGYALVSGIEAAARFSGLALAVCVSVTIYVIFSGRENFRFDNLLASTDAISFDPLLSRLTMVGDLLVFFVLSLYVANEKRAGASLYIAAAAGLGCLLFVFCEGCLSEYMHRTRYPFYTLANTSERSLLKGLDPVFLIVWIVTGLIRMSANLLAAFTAAKRLFGNSKDNRIKAVLVAAVAVLGIILSGVRG